MKPVNVKNQISSLLVAIFISLGLLIFELLGVMVPIYPYVYKLKSPFVSTGVKLIQIAITPYRVIKNSHKSYRRIQDLERNYSESLAQLSQLEGVAQENEYLKSLLSSSDIKTGHTVVLRSVSAYGQPAILLDPNVKLNLGNPVLISGTVVGRISELQQSQAAVELLSQGNPQSLLLAKTQSGAKGVIQGDGKRVLLTEVLRSDTLQVGERVFTQGQEGVASNLFIGKVQQIIKDDSSPVQTAILEQVVSFYETNIVEVRLE